MPAPNLRPYRQKLKSSNTVHFFGAGRSTTSHRQNVRNCFGNETLELTHKRHKLPCIMNTVQSVAGLDPHYAKYRDLSLQAFNDVYNSSTLKMEAQIPSETSVLSSKLHLVTSRRP
jgi:hypothetical protein